MGLSTLTTTPQTVTGVASQCGASAPAPIARDEAERRATLLKAVADPARLQLLSIVRASESGEACVCDMADAIGLSQPTVSHHLKVLVEAGVLTRERRGTWAWYTLMPEQLSEIARFLD
jgi:ArsR family transcriptional regulator, arsenate/arsenite/antimonite-responsive transcriptional repressor